MARRRTATGYHICVPQRRLPLRARKTAGICLATRGTLGNRLRQTFLPHTDYPAAPDLPPARSGGDSESP